MNQPVFPPQVPQVGQKVRVFIPDSEILIEGIVLQRTINLGQVSVQLHNMKGLLRSLHFDNFSSKDYRWRGDICKGWSKLEGDRITTSDLEVSVID